MAQTITLLPKKAYTGLQAIPSLSVPQGITQLALMLDRSAWLDSAVTVSAQLDLSLDNGTTWQSPYVGFSAQGGVILQPQTALPLPATRIVVTLPDPTNPRRRLRGQALFTGSFTTTGTLVLS